MIAVRRHQREKATLLAAESVEMADLRKGFAQTALGEQLLQLLFHSVGGEAAMTGLEASGLAASNAPVAIEAQLQALDGGRRSTANRQGNIFCKRKTSQGPAHERLSTDLQAGTSPR